MIICEPNDFVTEVHDRMPVLLRPEQLDHWLSGAMGVADLKPDPNDPTLIEPIEVLHPALHACELFCGVA
jgi:putative SOS response-associated peptidase YedK